MWRDASLLPRRPFVVAAILMLVVAFAVGLLAPSRYADDGGGGAGSSGGAPPSLGPPPAKEANATPPEPAKPKPPPLPPEAHPHPKPPTMPSGVSGAQTGGGVGNEGHGPAVARPSEVVAPPSLFSLLLTPWLVVLAAALALVVAAAATGRRLASRWVRR